MDLLWPCAKNDDKDLTELLLFLLAINYKCDLAFLLGQSEKD